MGPGTAFPDFCTKASDAAADGDRRARSFVSGDDRRWREQKECPFVVRVAGKIVEEAFTGSMEYAVEHLGVPLIVVMGHTRHTGSK